MVINISDSVCAERNTHEGGEGTAKQPGSPSFMDLRLSRHVGRKQDPRCCWSPDAVEGMLGVDGDTFMEIMSDFKTFIQHQPEAQARAETSTGNES